MIVLASVLGGLLVVAAVAASVWSLQRLRLGQRHLVGALELAHRQLTELREAVEESRSELSTRVDLQREDLARLRTGVEARLEAIGQAQRVRAAGAELEHAAARGDVAAASAEALRGELIRLEQECVSGGEPF
jgi:hypothetical protein